MKKYELVHQREDGLWQVKALKAFGNVLEGDLGGWIESEANLSHYGNAMVYGNAEVWGSAKVWGNAMVCENARVYGNAEVWGNAMVCENARVCENAEVWGNAEVYGSAKVYGSAMVWGNAMVCENARVCENAKIEKSSDYIVFKNNTTSGRYFTYTFSNDSLTIGCFFGTTQELEQHLIEKGNELQKAEYGLYLDLIKNLRKIKQGEL